jgi:uncharacterized membrane protein
MILRPSFCFGSAFHLSYNYIVKRNSFDTRGGEYTMSKTLKYTLVSIFVIGLAVIFTNVMAQDVDVSGGGSHTPKVVYVCIPSDECESGGGHEGGACSVGNNVGGCYDVQSIPAPGSYVGQPEYEGLFCCFVPNWNGDVKPPNKHGE